MRICVAQTNAIKGNVQKNIENHKKLINIAISFGVDVIIFPELSLTGFEPELAKDLATTQNDVQFDDFQKISDAKKIIIGVGMPTKSDAGIFISLLFFQPHLPRQTYSKQHLHSDEYPFFINGHQQIYLSVDDTKMAPVICYEISKSEHSENAYVNGVKVYLASVLNAVNKVEKDIERLSAIAQKYGMTAVMANYVGESGGYDCGGKSSIWNDEGVLVGQLNAVDEGILVFDTDTKEVIERVVLNL